MLERNTHFRKEGDGFQIYYSSVLPSFDKCSFLTDRPCILQEKKIPSTVLSFSTY